MPSRPRPRALGPCARVKAAPRAPNARAARRERPRAGVAVLLASGDPQRLLDLRDDARFGIEELLVHRLPTAERFDREEAGRRRELAAGDARDDGPVALRRPDLLGFGGEQIVDELLRLGRARAAAHDRDGSLDE